MFHLRRGDFSSWFKTIIKDEELAREAAEIECDETASPADSRERIREAVDGRYTASAICAVYWNALATQSRRIAPKFEGGKRCRNEVVRSPAQAGAVPTGVA
jgi:hypothetical protein